MPLKTIITDQEAIDALSEELRTFYAEKDGKYILDIEGVEEHPAVLALKNALESQKKQRKDLAAEVARLRERLSKIPDDFDVDNYNAIKQKLQEFEELGEADPAAKEKMNTEAIQARKMLEQKIANMEKTHAKEIDDYKKTLQKKDGFISQLLIDDGMTKALVEAGVDPKLMKAANALLRNDVRVVEEEGEYKAVVETDVGVVDIPRYVMDWAASDDGKAFIPPAKGADAGPGNRQPQQRLTGKVPDKNPWVRGPHFNMTEQGKIQRTDPVMADKLKKAAVSFNSTQSTQPLPLNKLPQAI